MNTSPASRKRYPQNVVTPGLAQVAADIWGAPNPLPNEVVQQLSAAMGFYRFHQGDIFLPGAPAFALDPSHDTPLTTVWGHSFLVRANAFRPLAVGQIAVTAPVQPLVGLGGPMFGQMIFQPLQVRGVEGT